MLKDAVCAVLIANAPSTVCYSAPFFVGTHAWVVARWHTYRVDLQRAVLVNPCQTATN